MLSNFPEIAGKTLLCLDFETYYDKDFTLSKMQMVEYINDPKFKVHMVGLRTENSEATVIPGDNIAGIFNQIAWEQIIVICHHAQFDGYILEQIYGAQPCMYIDTASLSRYVNGKRLGRSHSLRAVSKYLGNGEKGHELASSKGVEDLVAGGVYEAIAGYCATNEDSDVNLTWRNAQSMLPYVTFDVLTLQDWTVKCYTRPSLKLNSGVLDEAHAEELERMDNDLREALKYSAGKVRDLHCVSEIRKQMTTAQKRTLSVMGARSIYESTNIEEIIDLMVEEAKTGQDNGLTNDQIRTLVTEAYEANTRFYSDHEAIQDEARSVFNSAAKFKGLLESLGVEPPMKPSPSNPEKMIPAFAKTDEGMMDLTMHPDSRVAAAAKARLSVRNANIKNRSVRLLDHAAATGGAYSVALYASGAVQTNRYAGGDKTNCQNLTRGSKLRQAIEAALADNLVLAADYSNVEARVTDVMAGVEFMKLAYDQDDDPYVPLAAEWYGKAEADVTKDERQFGKVTKLACQYGVGAKTLRHAARFGWGLDMSEEDAQQGVAAYRAKHPQVVALWQRLDDLLPAMTDPQCDLLLPLGFGLQVRVVFEGLVMPTGFVIKYPNLRQHIDEKNGYERWVYGIGKDISGVWGGTMTENMSQHLAGEVANHHLLGFIRSGMPPAMMVHDEFVWAVPAQSAETYASGVEKYMGTRVPWWPEFPVAAEAAYGANYLEAK